MNPTTHPHGQPLPRWLLLPGGIALTFVALPLAGIATRIPWARVPHLLTSQTSLDALRLSLTTCLASTTLCLALGLPLALLLSRSHHRWTTLVRTLVTVPMVLPPVVAGLALLTTLGRRGLLGTTLSTWGIEIGFTTLAVVLAQTFVAMPYLVTAVEGALRAAGHDREDVAATLGASPTFVLTRITWPTMLPAVASGTALSFARSLGEFGATLTFAGSLQGVTRTLPLEIYLQRESDTDSALALALVLIIVAAATVAATGWAARLTPRTTTP
ncbi:molybdate transport system permease protein [Austwickia chelonae]|uniref:Molybdenum transport system permease n=1 Tax=Austwickia chelonae NBRC 105200 TaxID=1184607 RepID=K6UMT7_9MICO|nr:ABC transporter permease [Austwickia chelonae]GAB78396.1 molybdate ABC transporter permease protein [Austwickia chelonae NBRC 105200]SEW39202.1 molybdate transport system permease protein [Austwickia chelonae]